MNMNPGPETSRPAARPRESYGIDAIARACKVLKSFRRDGEFLRLRDIVQRTELNRTTVFRVLCTLVEEGLIERLGDDRYRTKIKISRSKKFRIAYASQAESDLFSREVSEGLRAAADENDIDLIEFDNMYSSERAIKNATKMVQARPDVAIEYQSHEQAGSVISSIFRQANIPLIAVSIPHPGSVYFGANGYSAGRVAGTVLAKWIRSNWNSEIDAIVLLEATMAGAVPHSRLTGVVTAIRESIASISEHQIKHLDGRGTFGSSLRAVQKYIEGSRAQRVVIAGANDASVIGGLRAFNEAGRLSHCIAVGIGGSFEARMELRRANTRLLGSVGFFPEKYGARLVRLAADLFHAKSVSPATYVPHRLITAQTVDQYYPNDVLMSDSDLELLLLQAP
ncbi:MAG: substrate-binding domain-containing protein [Acidobacteriota bacterium]